MYIDHLLLVPQNRVDVPNTFYYSPIVGRQPSENLSLHQKPFPLTPQTPLSWARNHFGCKDLKALFLEDEGDEGTADMHWEQTLFAVS